VRFGSVCSGIEAASVAWHPLGWRASFLSEIEAFPRAVLAHHYPETPLHGDFTTIKAGEYEPIDLLVGGTPCQSFSVAGLRGGLDDDRGQLALEYLRLADRLRPRWLVWENVPGVLSSNGGRDFGSFLGGLVELGYGFAYRVLDAQFFGVAQRRRRVFVVGYAGDWRRAAAVLFERHSLSGHPAPRREKGPSVAALTANGVGTCGADDNQGQAGHLIAHALRGEGFDASEDGTGRGTPIVPVYVPDAAATLVGRSSRGGGQTNSPGHNADQSIVAFDTTQITRAASFTDIAGSLRTKPPGSIENSSTTAVLCFSAKDHGADAMSDLSPTLRAGGHAGSHANAGVMPAVCMAVADTLGVGANQTTGFQSEVASFGSAVRRLTPRECERLQGFPDDYTLIPWRKGMAPDGPRYKALGNSMAVPVMAHIGRQIAAVDAIPQQQQEAA
jgi:DNA (cytosine-5)-methyltransferase 1